MEWQLVASYFTVKSTDIFCSVALESVRLSMYLPVLLWGGRVVRWRLVSFQCRGVLLIWIRVRQGSTALAMCAGGGCLGIFTLVYHFSSFSVSLGDGPI